MFEAVKRGLLGASKTTVDPSTLGPESPLCPDCRKALDLWGSVKDRANAGDGRPSRGPPETLLLQVESRLKDRIATGCRLCLMVYDSFEGETRSWESATFRNAAKNGAEPERETWGYIRSWRSEGPPNNKYRETDISIRRFWPQVEMKFSVRLHRVAKKECTGCPNGIPHDAKTCNPPPWDLMGRWLEECRAHHGQVCSAKSPDFLPSRLLDVGTLFNPILRLRLKDELQPNTKYFTLSHCWGPLVPKRLLLENLQDFRIRISEDELSKTFQEAIYATRTLAVQYLWIDSLCIIQNSAEDWQAEAAMMGQIYAGGLCNLAATAATEGSQGLFLYKLPLPQVIIDTNGSKDMWHLLENNSQVRGDALNFAPLNWRGWVFQERFLSTRVLHFGRGRVYWECGQQTYSEWPGKSIDQDVSSDNWTNQSKSKWQSMLNDTRILDKDEAVKMWTAIVDHYSSHCAFTFETDKLLAIAGLASRVHKSTQCRYFAGIWEHNLLRQLMWDVGSGAPQNIPSPSYVAPSWSWASVRVPVSRYMGSKVNYVPTPAVTIHSLGIELVTANVLGQVKGGHICLVGRLAVIQDLDARSGDDDLKWLSNILKMDRQADASAKSDRQRYLLLIEEQRVNGVFEGAGLVLEYMQGLKYAGMDNVFKRAGFFEFYFSKGEEDILGALQDEFEKTDFAKLMITQGKKDDKSLYTINII